MHDCWLWNLSFYVYVKMFEHGGICSYTTDTGFRIADISLSVEYVVHIMNGRNRVGRIVHSVETLLPPPSTPLLRFTTACCQCHRMRDLANLLKCFETFQVFLVQIGGLFIHPFYSYQIGS